MGFQAHFLSLKAYYREVQSHHPSSTPQSWPLSSSPHARITASTQALFSANPTPEWLLGCGAGLCGCRVGTSNYTPTVHQPPQWVDLPASHFGAGKKPALCLSEETKTGKNPFQLQKGGNILQHEFP